MIINELDKAFGHKRAELIEVNDGAFYYEKNEQTRFLTLRQLAGKTDASVQSILAHWRRANIQGPPQYPCHPVSAAYPHFMNKSVTARLVIWPEAIRQASFQWRRTTEFG